MTNTALPEIEDLVAKSHLGWNASSGQSIQERKTRMAWGYTKRAQFLLVFIALYFAQTLAQAQGGSPSSSTLARPMQFSSAGTGGNCIGCAWTAAQGTITTETPRAFAAFLRDNHPQGGVVFDSPGGELQAAIELALLIRRAGLSTSIGKTIKEPGSTWSRREKGICVSACAYAFLGGTTRYASEGYGVHQFFDPRVVTEGPSLDPSGPLSQAQTVVGLLTLFVKRMGADSELIFLASSTDPKQVYWLSTEELQRLHVDNSGTRQEPWRTEPYRGGAIARTRLTWAARTPLSISFFCGQRSGLRFLLLSRSMFTKEELSRPDRMTDDTLRSMMGSWELTFDGRSSAERPSGEIARVAISGKGVVNVTLPLNNSDYRALLSSKTVRVAVSLPSAFSYPFYGDVSLVGSDAHIVLAGRNCVQ